MPRRRELMRQAAQVAALLAGAGLWPGLRAQAQAGLFAAQDLDALARALGDAAPQESAGVSVSAPALAENGASVPVALASSLPGVVRLALLVARNPTRLAAVFEVGEAVEPRFLLRVKMAESSALYAVALLADGQVRYARQEVDVTLGGCGT